MLTAGKIRMAIASKVICLTKYEMRRSNCKEDIAFNKLARTKLFELLNDPGTRLFIEPLEYVEEAYRLEVEGSEKEMRDFIKYV